VAVCGAVMHAARRLRNREPKGPMPESGTSGSVGAPGSNPRGDPTMAKMLPSIVAL